MTGETVYYKIYTSVCYFQNIHLYFTTFEVFILQCSRNLFKSFLIKTCFFVWYYTFLSPLFLCSYGYPKSNTRIQLNNIYPYILGFMSCFRLVDNNHLGFYGNRELKMYENPIELRTVVNKNNKITYWSVVWWRNK